MIVLILRTGQVWRNLDSRRVESPSPYGPYTVHREGLGCGMLSRAELEATWKKLYSGTLPARAKARDPAQTTWPVSLDHCFARIILDNVIGAGREPWTKTLKSPAIKNMTEKQLQACLDLGEQIEHGDVDLVELDKQSLAARGTGTKKYRGNAGPVTKEIIPHGKRKDPPNLDTDEIRRPDAKQPKKRQTSLLFQRLSERPSLPSSPDSESSADHATILRKISSHTQLTPYRKRLYSTLMSVPRGRYTTYAALSDYLGSSARAVGNGMRNNPFAPDVPCHRVLAGDRSIGGFGGSWGKDGKHAGKKLDLLGKEGVKFDSRGKALGQPFRNLTTLNGKTDGPTKT